MAVGSVAKMVWGSNTPTAQQPVAVAPTPNAAAVTAGTSDLFTFGLPTGYTQKDLGDGRYEMFDTSGNSAGYGYKGVRDAIGELSYKNANAKTTNANGVWTNPYLQVAKSIWTDLEGKEMDVSGLQREQAPNVYGLQDAFFKPAPTDGYGNPIGEREQVYARQSEKMVNQEFSSEDEIKKQLEKYKTVGNYNGIMGDWEALGQVLEGNVAPNPQEWGNLPTDQKEQVIKGTGLLYGSTPVFSKDGQLIGYRTDLTPNDAKDWSNGTDKAVQKDFGTFLTHGGKSHSWNNANWREMVEPEKWKELALIGESGLAFIPKDAVDKIPGWVNKDSYSHKDLPNGSTGQVLATVAAVVATVFTAGAAAPALAAAAGMFVGNKVDGYDTKTSLTNAAVAGVTSYAGSAVSAAASGATSSVIGPELANTVVAGKLTVGKLVDNAIARAAVSAASAGLQGKEFNDAIAAGATSAIASLVGSTVGAGTQQATGSGMLGTVAGTVAGNLTGTAIRDATADTPDPVTRPTVTKPTTTLSNRFTAPVAKMIWS